MDAQLDVLLKQFLEEKFKANELLFSYVEEQRLRFIELYPIERIRSLSLADYTPVTQISKTFSSKLRWDLQDLGTMGNAFPAVFGVYESDHQIKMSDTFRSQFGDDYKRAFTRIKEDIVEVLEAANKEDFYAIERNELNSLFKNKLLMVYYPEKVIPVCVKKTLDDYCKAVGFASRKDMPFIIKNRALKEYKDQSETFSDWSNSQFMGFCDWLRRNEKKVVLKSALPPRDVEKAIKIENEIDSLNLIGEDKEAIVKARVNQGVFRDRLLHKYSKCCLCNVSLDELLVASHIKPWAVSSPEERLDVSNGFLLCPTHDKLFDKGLISFDDNGNILISDKLDEVNRTFCNVNKNMCIELSDEQRGYLEYHRKVVYKDIE